MTFSIRSAFHDAHSDREVLMTEYDAGEGFTPAVDGSVTPERMTVFLEVRDALGRVRADLDAVDAEMGDFDELAGEEEPPVRVALPAVARLTRSILALPWIFGEIERTRNRALVEAGMGLDEYTYVYFVSYHDEILDPDGDFHLFGGTAVNDRIREQLVDMLRRQLEAARSDASIGEEWVDTLAGEVAALDRDPDRLPWPDGLPVAIAGSISPYRERLDAGYSVAAAELELLNSTIRNGGLTIEMN
jgi:hypothetical protein